MFGGFQGLVHHVLSSLVAWGRAARTFVVRTDVDRWSAVENEAPAWEERSRIIASLIPDKSAVLGLGAGSQSLRRHLKPACAYQPCDIVAGRPDVLYCDFNSGAYPRTDRTYDYSVCSGVLEYVLDPRDFLRHVMPLARTTLLSYAARGLGESTVSRLAQGWKNHLTRDELESLFRESGLDSRIVGEWQGQILYELRSGAGASR